ncbi:protein Iojap, chloroplastic-like [Juglans regia]|uniref:Protein Iojap, chloroplastic-like n=1 Tax=Juglans regia TaxID=51240 RepID=A0A6P9E4H8_JUGRE|nr:protein Iojap, chloroplastic-like [Juglans regia]
MLSIAGTGAGTATEFFGEFRHLCRVESKFRQRPKRISVCKCMDGNNFSHHNCIWRLPSTRNFNFKTRDSYLVMAIGKENVSEDTDDTYDDLFNKFGKMVFRRKDQKPHSEEVDDDDDAESLSPHHPLQGHILPLCINSRIYSKLLNLKPGKCNSSS